MVIGGWQRRTWTGYFAILITSISNTTAFWVIGKESAIVNAIILVNDLGMEGDIKAAPGFKRLFLSFDPSCSYTWLGDWGRGRIIHFCEYVRLADGWEMEVEVGMVSNDKMLVMVGLKKDHRLYLCDNFWSKIAAEKKHSGSRSWMWCNFTLNCYCQMEFNSDHKGERGIFSVSKWSSNT